MPALVPADVLGQLTAASGLLIAPIVGSVRTNEQWVAEELAAHLADAHGGPDLGFDEAWSALFDEADGVIDTGPSESSESDQAA
jgi:hypothetical protein